MSEICFKPFFAMIASACTPAVARNCAPDGLTSNGDVEYFIRVLEHRPADFRVLTPGADRTATPLDSVPIEAPVKFYLAINLAAAQRLGLTIPEPLQRQADQLITSPPPSPNPRPR